MRSIFWALLILSLACVRTGPQAQPPSSPLPNAETAGFMPGDKLEIRVYGEDKLSGIYRVDDDGTIDFPLVGEIDVLGLSQGALARDLEGRLGDGYLTEPQVTVLVEERENLEVSVLGEVAEPGRMPYVDNLTLVQALSAAGGPTEYAADRRIRLTRRGPDGPETFEVSLRDIAEGRREDLVLRAGDIVYVPSSPL
jgi:polysaccharide export outer membrane protein